MPLREQCRIEREQERTLQSPGPVLKRILSRGCLTLKCRFSLTSWQEQSAPARKCSWHCPVCRRQALLRVPAQTSKHLSKQTARKSCFALTGGLTKLLLYL